MDIDDGIVVLVQLVESWACSIFVASWVLGSIAALWPGYFETIVLAEVPFGIGVAIEVGYRAARSSESYCSVAMVVRVVERLIENFARGFVHSFDSMIHSVNHMRLRLNNVDDVGIVFFLVFFFFLRIV